MARDEHHIVLVNNGGPAPKKGAHERYVGVAVAVAHLQSPKGICGGWWRRSSGDVAMVHCGGEGRGSPVA